ncbi:RmlC-like jelly roll fold domain-containing protein [Rozella allomycis CSF55]|uniref:RmlC-like jelly roll fold domain-containing protein n=1 Tax=Rozella allomycis (strain CSF55) TaxID=988480 RepID=A0A075AYR0_ROZAC|nr:RmlC-like jelly roll fold domain-containing protein [Rozella allomycis CSF55]|eukprot:EPZ35259.1 RmlC-like jelly roll fold domain-containing protein [Rozella allomycis CSF55]
MFELVTNLKSHDMFSTASEDFILNLASTMNVRIYQPGSTIIQEGDHGKTMFFLLKGTVNVIAGDSEIILAELKQGLFFGELALLFDCPRTASVIAKTKCIVSALTGGHLQQMLASEPQIEAHFKKIAQERYDLVQNRKNGADGIRKNNEETILDSLMKVKALNFINDSSILKSLCDILEKREYKADDIIFSVSDPATNVFIVLDGTVDLISQSNNENIVKMFKYDSFVGGSLASETYCYNAVAATDCFMLVIKRHILNDMDRGKEVLSSMCSIENSISMGSSHSLYSSLNNSLNCENGLTNDHPTFELKIDVPFEIESKIENKETSGFLMPTNEALSFNPLKRRASVAVWADSRLANLAASKNNLSSYSSPLKNSLISSKNNGSNENTELCISHILKFLPLKDKLICRSINQMWFRGSKMEHSGNNLDFVPINKKITPQDFINTVSHFSPHTKHLTLRLCYQINDKAIIDSADFLENLETIDLHSCWDITNVGVSYLAQKCGLLKSINLSNCRKIDDDAIHALLLNAPLIESMSLSYCKLLTNNTMLFICQMGKNLRSLNLQRCTGISDAGFYELDNNLMQSMTDLDLSDCSFLTDAAISACSKGMPNLKTLNLSFCCSLSPEALSIIADSFDLESLDLSFCGSSVTDNKTLNMRGCVGLTDSGVRSIINYAKNLLSLNVTGCKQISASLVDECSRLFESPQAILTKPPNMTSRYSTT